MNKEYLNKRIIALRMEIINKVQNGNSKEKDKLLVEIKDFLNELEEQI